MAERSWLVIYDLDGVWLSEEAYLNAAALAVAAVLAARHPGAPAFAESRMQDATAVQDVRDTWLPGGVVRLLRSRGINSNWDKALAAAIAWRAVWNDGQPPHPAKPQDAPRTHVPAPTAAERWLASIPGKGSAFLDALRARAPDTEVMRRDTVGHFQRFFLGDARVGSPYLRAGLAAQESCLVDAAQAAASLACLRRRGCALGIGTGRPRAEAQRALEAIGLWANFAPGHVATADEAAREERRLGLLAGTLLKPHPFTFMAARAEWPKDRCVVVGDSPADAQAAADAGIAFIAVGSEEDAGGWAKEAFAVIASALEVPDVLEPMMRTCRI